MNTRKSRRQRRQRNWRQSTVGVLVASVIAIAGCASEKIGIRPFTDAEIGSTVLGVGLEARFSVVVVSCGGVGDCFDDGSVTMLEAEVANEQIASLVGIEPAGCDPEGRCRNDTGLRLRGEGAGLTEVELRTEIEDRDFDMPVADVEATRILLRSATGTLSGPHARDEAADRDEDGDAYRVLRGSTLALDQEHFSVLLAPDDELPQARLFGDADLMLDPGATRAALDTTALALPVVTVGDQLGTATLTTSVGGQTQLDVVDATSVAELVLVDVFGEDEVSAIELHASRSFHLIPQHTDGRWILGAGDEAPSVTSSDPGVIAVTLEEGLTRRAHLEVVSAGQATITATWLGRALEIDVLVSP